MSIEIDEPTNVADTTLYARHKLQEVADFGHLDKSWPGSALLDEFILKAGGLFIWIFIVSEYLRKRKDPDRELRALLSKQIMAPTSAEAKMDEMYSTILKGCDWDDEAFVAGYNLIIGAIIAAKTPLSMSALQSLHRHDLSQQVRVENYLCPLAPLLTMNLDK